MPNAALSAQHVACLIIAASKGEDWTEHEHNAVREGNMPFCYISSRERMNRADKLTKVRVEGIRLFMCMVIHVYCYRSIKLRPP